MLISQQPLKIEKNKHRFWIPRILVIFDACLTKFKKITFNLIKLATDFWGQVSYLMGERAWLSWLIETTTKRVLQLIMLRKAICDWKIELMKKMYFLCQKKVKGFKIFKSYAIFCLKNKLFAFLVLPSLSLFLYYVQGPIS